MDADIVFLAILFGLIFASVAAMAGPTLWRDYKERKTRGKT